MRYLVSNFLLFLCVLAVPTILVAQEEEDSSYVVLDYDGDNISDIVKIEDEGDGSNNTLIREIKNSSDGSVTSVQFGRTGDIYADGKYHSERNVNPAIVREDEEGGVLLWRERIAQGNVEEVIFGNLDDYVLAGCDFTGDGLTDRAVITTAGVLRVMDSTDLSGETIDETTLNLPSGFLLHHAICDSTGDDIQVLLLVSEPTATFRAKKKCKEKFSTKKKIRKCRKRRKKKKEQGGGDDSSTTRLRSIILFDSEGAQVSKHSIDDKAQVPVMLDYDNDEVKEAAVLRIKKKKSFINTHLPNDQEGFDVIEIETGQDIKDAIVIRASAEGEEESKDSLLMIDGDGALFQMDLNSTEIVALVEQGISGQGLLHPTNLEATGSTHPEDPTGQCDDIKEFADSPGVENLIKKPDHPPAKTVALITKRDGYTAKTLKIQKNGQDILFYNTGEANPDQYGARVHFRNNDFSPSYFGGGLVVVGDKKGKTHCFTLPDQIGSRLD